MAAGVQIEDLVADQERLPNDWRLIRELMRKAGTDVINDVRALLSGHSIDRAGGSRFHVPPDRVALIGLRGAGKTTLGRLAAKKLGWRFVELNREIEKEAGFSISEVFSFYGLRW
jgi:XRE family aerobic/anaerobic benzoate catabolism transcriptional regulator